MKKLIVLLLMVGMVYAAGYSRNWTVTTKTVSGNLRMTAPYTSSGLMIDHLGGVTLSVMAQGVTMDDIVRGSRPANYYPLNWSSRGGQASGWVTLNALTSTNCSVIWYENNN